MVLSDLVRTWGHEDIIIYRSYCTGYPVRQCSYLYRQMPTNTKLKRLVHHQVRLHLLRYRSNIRRAEFKLYTRKIGKSRS